jgi:hypothetical protein
VKRLVLALALVAACGGGAKKPPPTPPTNTAANDGPTNRERCDQVAARAAAKAHRSLPEDAPTDMRTQFEQMLQQMQSLIAKHCVDDAWSDEVLDCAEEHESAKECKEMLTAAQQKSLDDDVERMIGGAKGE